MSESARKEDGGGCASFIAGLAIFAVAWFFVPLSLPFTPKGLDFCSTHQGVAEINGTMVDYVQTEANVSCNDGTVRWVRW